MSNPNIVFITSDECKATALGCYSNEYAHTPCIDSLAQEGLLFENSYVTFPKCVPSRCAMMTSRYPHVEGHRTLPGFHLRKGENNLMLEMKKRRYKTALFGKNHLVDWDYIDTCFDEYTKEWPGIHTGKFHREEHYNNLDKGLFRALCLKDELDGQELADSYQVNFACDFIRRHRAESFMLLLDIGNPHPVYSEIRPYIDIIREKNIKLPVVEKLEATPQVLRAYRKTYDLEDLTDEQWRKIVEAYYSMVAYADSQVGKVIDTLKQEGIMDNTIVVFTSDHGDFAGEHGCVEKWDTMFYDCLVRVPLIIKYPGVEKGLRLDSMIENVDLAPTLLEFCGFEVPEWMQGKSALSYIRGITAEHKDAVFSEGGVEKRALNRALSYKNEFYHEHQTYQWKQKTMVDNHFTMIRSKMVRTKEWKLVYRVDGTKELYNLLEDPMELSDVAAVPENKEIIYGLIERLLQWEISTETDYPPITDMRA